MEEFPLYNRPSIGNTSAVLSKYNLTDLSKMVVLRNEANQNFIVFKTRSDFSKWYAGRDLPLEGYHEVIAGDLPQRLKFDIDAHIDDIACLPDLDITNGDGDADVICNITDDSDISDLLDEFDLEPDDPNESKICAFMKLLINVILDELYVAYYDTENIYPTEADLIVTESSGAGKYSFHIITKNHYVMDVSEAKGFTARVMDNIPKAYHKLVDISVNKSLQNFRLLNSSKLKSDRVKRVTTRFGTGEPDDELLISAPPGVRVLPQVYYAPEKKVVEVKDNMIKEVLDIANANGLLHGFTYKETRGSLLCFTRIFPSYCRICGEVHHNDNSLMLSIAADGQIREHCRQSRKFLEVGEVEVEMGVGANTHKGTRAKNVVIAPKEKVNQITRIIDAIKSGQVNPHDALASKFEKCDGTVYSEPQMRDFELVPTLAVLAQMKLGKTKATKKYIDAHFPPSSGKVVRFVTFRQTFSSSIGKAFQDFVSYKDINGNIYQSKNKRVIIQVESLHRLYMDPYPEAIDLLVLDEVESIFAQFNSGLHKFFGASYAMFEWMMRTAKHVIVMDANLSDRTFNTLERMRPGIPIVFHWNKFQRAAGDLYEFTANQGVWLVKLYEELAANKKIVIPVNSLNEAKTIKSDINSKFPSKSVMLYSSETSTSEKNKHFGDVHTYWNGLDVLIFTPTCSAGVSFELEHYDILFGYFCDKSCDVETCRQMLGRVRNLKERKHYVCLQSIGSFLPTTVEDIRRLIYDKRNGLYKKCDGLQFSYGDNGEIEFYESSFFHLWLENERICNLSLNDFTKRFISQVADTGATINVMVADPDSAMAASSSHQTTKDMIKLARCESVANSENIGADEANAIRDSLQLQDDVDLTSRYALEKFRLRDHYMWHDKEITADWVDLYSTPDAKRVYRALKAISCKPTLAESLELIRLSERAHYEYNMMNKSAIIESQDLLRDRYIYMHSAHAVAVRFVKMCGFACITARNMVHIRHIEARIRVVLPSIINIIPNLASEFKLSESLVRTFKSNTRETDTKKFISGMLRLINSIIRFMYGMQISRKGEACRLDYNNTGRLFVLCNRDDADDKPYIESNLRYDNQYNDVNYVIEELHYDSDSDSDSELGVDESLESSSDLLPDSLSDSSSDDLDSLLDSFA